MRRQQLHPDWWNWIFLILAVGTAFQVSHHSSRSFLQGASTSLLSNGWVTISSQLRGETSSAQEQLSLEDAGIDHLPPSQRRYSLHHILHPLSHPDPHEPNSIVGLSAALRFMQEALAKLPHSSSSVQHDFYEGNFLRLETRVHSCEIIQWLLSQNDQHRDALYMQTQQRTVAALGVAARYNGTNDSLLPEHSVWYGAGRFDQDYPNKDPRWEELQDHWILPTVELSQKNDTFTLAVHVCRATWNDTIQIMKDISGQASAEWENPPPILSRVASNDVYEDAVELALKKLSDEDLDKVVLARGQTLQFYRKFSSLHLLRQLLQEEIHGVVFYIKSGDSEFWGATPEKLFDISNGKLQTEALAGTRVRGSTVSDDSQLLQDLLNSEKDRRENQLTADYIEDVLSEFQFNRTYGVRRLRHLQHICQQYTATLHPQVKVLNTARRLWRILHPTPAVGGLPQNSAIKFLRKYEGWDRGLYAGPVGYMGNADDAFLGVAIRSALSTTNPEATATEVQVFGGSGLVRGSTLHGEWSETNSKLAVLSSCFSQSPVSLRSSPTPNVAWATAFCEELIRNGVTQFYICPGSRSTPLVVAIVQAAKKNPFVRAESVHDERSAGFRAVGYARGAHKPAVVVTSSGTAVANLYPAVVEAGMDGLPIIVLTADRPYENRATGANQAIDQVKIFSSSYVRWFQDVLPPSDDVPVSSALSDACHAVSSARELLGPVHLNVQFRENLAPDAGPIRNDIREGSMTKFNGIRYTDVPGFGRWSSGGQPWFQSFSANKVSAHSVVEVAKLIQNSSRGIIIIGGLRQDSKEGLSQAALRHIISDFAEQIGFPIVAGAQCAALRFTSPSVIPFAEHILRSPVVKEELDIDLVIQIGWPIVSTAVPGVIALSAKERNVHHILVHPHSPGERLDPEATVTHRVAANPSTFLLEVAGELRESDKLKLCFSELYTLICFGRQLQSYMKDIVGKTGDKIRLEENRPHLTEPELIMDLAESFADGDQRNLFLSSSMPVRDAEMFLYPYDSTASEVKGSTGTVACNRGASGIDGILASALGFAEGSSSPTTLVVGDLATVHDVGSLFSLRAHTITARRSALTTIVVNNNGGGIFSFLPISQHKADVEFDKHFGTPTDGVAFDSVARAFGLLASKTTARHEFTRLYNNCTALQADNLIEVKVFDRDTNVRVHTQINDAVLDFVQDRLVFPSPPSTRLGIQHRTPDGDGPPGNARTLLLLHGWMGSSSDWDPLVKHWTNGELKRWNIVRVDLPGHGKSPILINSADISLQRTLGVGATSAYARHFSIDGISESVEKELLAIGIDHLDAVVGYSAGGRVALSLKSRSERRMSSLISEKTQIVLIGANPGEANSTFSRKSETLAELEASLCKDSLASESPFNPIDTFIERWYQQPMWGMLATSSGYRLMAQKRVKALRRRGRDLLEFLRYSKTSGGNTTSWTGCCPENTLFIAGDQDVKYASIGTDLASRGVARLEVVKGAGHAALVEVPERVAELVEEFLFCNLVSLPKADVVKLDSSSTKAQQSKVGASSKDIEYNPSDLENSVLDQKRKTGKVGEATTRSNEARSNNLRIRQINLLPISFGLRDERLGPLRGVGWGEAARSASAERSRQGFLIEMKNCHLHGLEVGIGEVSPLKGVHMQTLAQLTEEATSLQRALDQQPLELSSDTVLLCNGYLEKRLRAYTNLVGLPTLSRSLHAGIEMAVLSLAAEKVGQPLHQRVVSRNGQNKKLAINGLITRDGISEQNRLPQQLFPSYKVKVGYQQTDSDQDAMKEAFRLISYHNEAYRSRLRADANRAWTESQAIAFATLLEGLDIHALDKIEFIEEPLQVVGLNTTLQAHIEALERNFLHTGIPYALDETIADLAERCGWQFELICENLTDTFSLGRRGCAAFVLKPTVLGLELSLQLARYAKSELGIGAVFSSCFESGLGLAHIALLAHAADSDEENIAPSYPHGLGTFVYHSTDTLSPSFGSYVDVEGNLNIASISRSLFGLSLDELTMNNQDATPPKEARFGLDSSNQDPSYEASTAVGPNKEINVVASVHLPFSVQTAFSKFTDLPAMSRWSPWIQNVRYDGNETEWKINIRGVPLCWRAESEIVNNPNPGIQWRSVSGIENCGVVEFVQDRGENRVESCRMNVDMKIVPPRLLRPIFQNASVFLEDFLREKLLKWSLEMFRDAVKADMALERLVLPTIDSSSHIVVTRGDIELGDALIGAVEGKSSAIEETLGPRSHGINKKNKK